MRSETNYWCRRTGRILTRMFGTLRLQGEVKCSVYYLVMVSMGASMAKVAVLLFVAVKYVPFAPEGVVGVREFTPDLADDVIRPARQAGPTILARTFRSAGLVAGHRVKATIWST